MPILRSACAMIWAASLSDPPAGRLNEMVPATRPLWWFTWVAVWLFEKVIIAESGTMVSAAVLFALPLELPPLLFEMLLVCWFASASAFSEFVFALVLDALLTAAACCTALTVARDICVCCVPFALPAAVLR